MCVCVYVCMVNVCRTPPPPARPAEQYVLSAEEMTYLAARRQSELQRVEEGKAAVAAAAAKARLGWAKAGGEYQAHPDIANQGRRINVEGDAHTHTTRAHAHTHHTPTGIGCRLSLLETAVGDLKKILLSLNQIQKATIPYEKLMDIWAEFDSIASSLDQRFFNTFAELDLLSDASVYLALEVDDKRKKRRAGDEETLFILHFIPREHA